MRQNGTETPSEGRRWLAVVLATVIMLLSYLLFVYSLAALSGEETEFAGALLGIALGLVPGVFVVAAFVSQNQTTVRSGLAATGLWLVVALPLALVDLATGLVAGFGLGGVVAFRLGQGNTRRSRVIAVLLCVVYTFIVQRISPRLGLFAGAPLPFLAIAAADMYVERAGRSV